MTFAKPKSLGKGKSVNSRVHEYHILCCRALFYICVIRLLRAKFYIKGLSHRILLIWHVLCEVSDALVGAHFSADL